MSTIIDKTINYFEDIERIYGNKLFVDKNIETNLENSIPHNLNLDLIEQTDIEMKKNKVVASNDLIQSTNTIDSDWNMSKSLVTLNDKIHNCLECKLGATRNKFVFGSGNHNADIIIIGEAPGADEDAQGLPFVGRAGQLLTKIIESVNFTRDEVFIANIIKCRPPDNRKPEKDEVEKCRPYLLKQIDIIQPKLLLLLGLTAVESLTGNKVKMADVRGKFTEFHGIKTFITYHPSALLRNPNLKADVWEDMKLFRKEYKSMVNE